MFPLVKGGVVLVIGAACRDCLAGARFPPSFFQMVVRFKFSEVPLLTKNKIVFLRLSVLVFVAQYLVLISILCSSVNLTYFHVLFGNTQKRSHKQCFFRKQKKRNSRSHSAHPEAIKKEIKNIASK